MLCDKRRETGQKTIGKGLAINPVDDFGRRQIELLQKLFFQGGRKLIFQNISYQQFPKYGTATFISQNKSERRDVADDLFSIVKTRIGPRPQNTGDTSLLAT